MTSFFFGIVVDVRKGQDSYKNEDSEMACQMERNVPQDKLRVLVLVLVHRLTREG